VVGPIVAPANLAEMACEDKSGSAIELTAVVGFKRRSS
jgi:hypothetical protein